MQRAVLSGLPYRLTKRRGAHEIARSTKAVWSVLRGRRSPCTSAPRSAVCSFGPVATQPSRACKPCQDLPHVGRPGDCVYRSTALTWQIPPEQCRKCCPCTAPGTIRLLGVLGRLPALAACQTLPVLCECSHLVRCPQSYSMTHTYAPANLDRCRHADDGGPTLAEGFCAVIQATSSVQLGTVVEALAAPPVDTTWETTLAVLAGQVRGLRPTCSPRFAELLIANPAACACMLAMA